MGYVATAVMARYEGSREFGEEKLSPFREFMLGREDRLDMFPLTLAKAGGNRE